MNTYPDSAGSVSLGAVFLASALIGLLPPSGQAVEPADLPASSFSIEIEHFDYDGGKAVPAVNTMPYAGDEYAGLGAVFQVDYERSNSGNDAYRSGENPNVPLTDNLGNRWGADRPGFEVTTNYRMGWIGNGEWYNFTRDIPAGFYRSYAALSIADTNPGSMFAWLGRVTAGAGTPEQTVEEIGRYSGPGSGGWGQNSLIPLLDTEGAPLVFELPGGPVTLRFTTGAGDVDWFTLSPVGAAVVAASPAPGSLAPRNTPLEFTIRNFNGNVDPATVKLLLDGTDVTSQSAVTVVADGATVSHDPGLFEKETSHTYELSFQDDADPPDVERFSGSFQVSPLGGPGVYVIEAEDFDFGGGQHQPEADVMPYLGGAYEGVGAVHNVDYHTLGRTDNDLYRSGEEPNLPIGLTGAPETKDRGDWQVDPNYVVGWARPEKWLNYTRAFPAGLYEVFAAMSHNGTGAHDRRSQLGLVVSGQGTEEQTVVPLGVFDAPGTGDWEAYSLIPLTDGVGGRVFVNLPANATLRWTQDSGNLDFLVLFAAGEAPAPADALIRAGTEAIRPFKLDDVYQSQPVGEQVVEQTAANGETARFQVQAQNDGDAPRQLTVRAVEAAPAGWSVRYWAGAGEIASDITAEIVSPAGHVTPELGPGESELITLEMTAQPRVPGGSVASVDLSVAPGPDVQPSTDVVRAVTRVALNIRPDLMIANQGDWNYAGERVFNLDAVGQTRFQALLPGFPAWYQVRLENHANAPGEFLITGTEAPAGATVRYLAPKGVLNFDGASGQVALGGWTAGSQWTLEAWIRPSSLPSGRHTIVGGMGGCVDWALTLVDGHLGMTIRPGGCTASPRLEETAEVGRWYHVAATCDGQTASLYVDGQLALTSPIAKDYVGYADVRIGGSACCSNEFFPGQIREVRVWDRPLTEVEIQTGMTTPPAPDADGLAGWWPLDEGFGTTAHDLTANARHGALQGGVAWLEDPNPTSAVDITAAATGAGWTTRELMPGEALPLLIELRLDSAAGPAANSPGLTDLEALLTARSTRTDEADAVKAVLMATTPPDAPQTATYTTTGDFEQGRMVGVEARSTLDQLQLEPKPNALPFIWVPNSNESTVSLVDTRTGDELGRYRTGPEGRDGNPSRTTVDLLGNCWVGNRTSATVVKIGLRFNGQFIDRNGDGIIQTSQDLNGDGDITGAELLPWGADECVLFEISVLPGLEGLHSPGDPNTPYAQERTYKVNLQDPVRRGLMAGTHVPGDPDTPYANDYWTPGPRGLAVDVLNNLWLGTYGTKTFYYIDGATGQILKVIDVSSVNHTSYGAVIDRSGILWSSGQDKNHVLRLDPADDTFHPISLPHFTYGLGLDLSDRGKLFVSGWNNTKLSRVDLATETVDWTVEGRYESRGVAVTDDGSVWTANSGPGTVTRFDPDGVPQVDIPVGRTPTGVAVDQAGKVWVVNYDDEYIHRINPLTDSIDLSKRLIGTLHYGYSDMTGRIVRNATTRLGIWTVRHDTGFRNTPWARLTWVAQEPEGTDVKVRVRSSNDQTTWSGWEVVFNDLPLRSTPPGRFLEIEAQLQSVVPQSTPVLEELTVVPGADINLGERFYDNDFTDGAGPEWSVDQVTQPPVGNESLLGMFGDQVVTFQRHDLPPHTLVAIECDLVVSGPWAGNDPTTGPDLFQADLAGGLTLLRTTFHNGPSDQPLPGQAYPDAYPGGQHPPRTDAVANNTLGYPGGDATYRLLLMVPHTAESLVVNFSASGLTPPPPAGVNVRLAGRGLAGAPTGAAWGLDNVTAYLTRVAAPLTLVASGFNGLGQFQLELYGEVQATYTLESSEDLRVWTPLDTRKLTANPLLLTDPTSPAPPYRFYRAVLKP